jgi:hypothetical protein
LALTSERGWRAPNIWWAALVLVVAINVVHGPALDRVFVADQLWYFAELDGHTALSAGLHHYDYAATRRYWKGDDALFRPLLFVGLAVENSLFTYHHRLWNRANLLLHTLVALFLFRLLATIQPSPFALAAALLFAVMKPPLELVLWSHLGGYIAGCLFLMIGVRALVLMVRAEGQPRARLVATYALSFSAASLCHESMVIAALLAAVLAGWAARRTGKLNFRRGLVLFSPVLVFSALYFLHTLRVERLSYVDRGDQGVFARHNIASIVPRSLEVMARWTEEAALPSALSLTPRLFDRLGKSFAISWQSPLQLGNALLAITGLIVIGMSVSWRHTRQVFPILAVLFGAATAYAVVICVGRPQNEVLACAYYPYEFCLLLVAFIYTLVDVDRVHGWTAGVASIVLTAFVIAHATQTHGVAREIGLLNQVPSRFLSAVSGFVDSHAREPDFTFAIVGHPPGTDPEIQLREGYPDSPASVVFTRRVTEILFRRYYSTDKPKYIFGANGTFR